MSLRSTLVHSDTILQVGQTGMRGIACVDRGTQPLTAGVPAPAADDQRGCATRHAFWVASVPASRKPGHPTRLRPAQAGGRVVLIDLPHTLQLGSGGPLTPQREAAGHPGRPQHADPAQRPSQVVRGSLTTTTFTFPICAYWSASVIAAQIMPAASSVPAGRASTSQFPVIEPFVSTVRRSSPCGPYQGIGAVFGLLMTSARQSGDENVYCTGIDPLPFLK